MSILVPTQSRTSPIQLEYTKAKSVSQTLEAHRVLLSEEAQP